MRRSVEERFRDGWVEAEEPHSVLGTKCWLWTKCKDTAGYGIIYREGARRPAHRVGYEIHVGPIPKGLQLDHLCRVRHCVNPNHVEPVTQRENIRRGIRDRIPKTHCKQGHPFSGDNLYMRPTGHRACRACIAVACRTYRLKNREACRKRQLDHYHRTKVVSAKQPKNTPRATH